MIAGAHRGVRSGIWSTFEPHVIQDARALQRDDNSLMCIRKRCSVRETYSYKLHCGTFIAAGPRRMQAAGVRAMISARRLQQSFADGLIAEEVADLWEPWMRHADEALNDDELLEIIQDELSKRCKKSKTRGRPAIPAEVILRMLLLKHMRDWSYEDVTREVRANLVYREFTRIGGGKVPDDKSMSRLSRQLGPEAIAKLHQRVVTIAQQKKVVQGRKLRVDTTVVETNIHYPTDSTLLNDGVRVLTRVMKQVTAVAGEVGDAVARRGSEQYQSTRSVMARS